MRGSLRTGVIATALCAALFANAACGADGTEQPEGAATGGGSGQGVGEWASLLTIDPNDADPKIEQTQVKLAQAPYWDHSTEQIGIEKGWYKEVGIEIAPPPAGTILDMAQIAPALTAGQIDVGTMVPQIWANELDQGSPNAVFTFRDIFMGHAILAAPGSGLRTTDELIKAGTGWPDAARQAVEQLRGKEVYITAEASPRAFRSVALELAGMALSDLKVQTTDEATMMQLALAGRADFVSPHSGPDIVTLISRGWKPVITTRDIVEHGDPEQLTTVIVNTGLSASKEWLRQNPETALRMASVGYRIIDLKKKDPADAAAIQIPFINKIAGTSFKESDAKVLDEVIDPFYSFEEQAQFFEQPDSPFSADKVMRDTIKLLVEQGILQDEHDPATIMWADSTWKTLKSLKEKTDPILAELDAKTDLPAKAAEQLAKAKAFHAAFNYLDAYRFANAAKLNGEGG